MKSGKLAETVLKRSVLNEIKQQKEYKSAAIGSDCAFFSVREGDLIVWRSQEAAVAVQADMVSLSQLVMKCANNLAAAGATPISAQIAVMLPENIEESLVKELVLQMVLTCNELGVELTGGDTNVSYAVNAPIATVTMMGTADKNKVRTLKDAKAGQDIVVSKWIGLEGTAILARACREELLARYPEYLVDEAMNFEKDLLVGKEALVAVSSGVGAMHDLSQGGIFGGIWELAEGSGLGLTADLRKIPIRQETVEVCEVCGVNPYEMRSGGSLLMTADDGEALVQALAKEQIPATVIGKLTDSRDRILINEEEVRYLTRPDGRDVITEKLQSV